MNTVEEILLLSAVSVARAYLCGEGLGQVECMAGSETCAFIQMKWKCMSCQYTKTHCHTEAMAEDCRPYCDSLTKDKLIEGLNNTIFNLTGERENLRREVEAQKQSAQKGLMKLIEGFNNTIFNLTGERENLRRELEAQTQSAQRGCFFVLCPLPILLGVVIAIILLLLMLAVSKCCLKKCRGRSERHFKRSKDEGFAQQLTEVTVGKLNTANPAEHQIPGLENKSMEESQPDAHGGLLDFKVDQKDPLKAVNPENHDFNNERTLLLPTGATVREDHGN